MVTFDRPGYGESDPDPKRTIKSLALDMEELADKLELGDKFYVIGYSMGQQGAWGSLKYIPHRWVQYHILYIPMVSRNAFLGCTLLYNPTMHILFFKFKKKNMWGPSTCHTPLPDHADRKYHGARTTRFPKSVYLIWIMTKIKNFTIKW